MSYLFNVRNRRTAVELPRISTALVIAAKPSSYRPRKQAASNLGTRVSRRTGT